MQGGRLVLAAGAAFVLFALLSYVFVRPGKHDREPYDAASADLAGDRVARQKLADGSSCFSVLGDAHDMSFRLAKCLAKRMRQWREIISFDVQGVSADEYMRAVTELRKEISGMPIVVDEETRPIIAAVGCPGQGRQYIGDLEDLMEIAVTLRSGPDAMTVETLKKECA